MIPNNMIWRIKTINFLRKLDYATLRNYELKYLLKYELTATSFFFTKDGHWQKSPKSELATERKLSSYTPAHWTETNVSYQFHVVCQKGSCRKSKNENFLWLVQTFMVNFQKSIGNILTDGYSLWFIEGQQYQIPRAWTSQLS